MQSRATAERLPAIANPAGDVLVTEPEAAVSVSSGLGDDAVVST